MRLKGVLVALGAFFLLVTGFHPDSLPFVPGVRFSDAVVSHWPNALYLRESVLERQMFPLWRETIMAGQPFAANPLNKTAYPLQWLVLLLPPTLHLDMMIALHLLLAGWGMWRWARLLGLPEEASALSALAYALTPKLIGHLGAGHLDILYALAWWPWLMEAIRHAVAHSESPITGALRTSVYAALLFLADVRLSLFALSAAAAYELAGYVETRQWRRSYRQLLIVIPFFLMTASALAPLLAWQPYLSRAELTPAEAGVFSLEWGHLVGLILPAHEGNFETLTYLGISVLALASIAIIAEPRKHLFWLALLAFAGLYAMGTNGGLWPFLVNLESGLLRFRVPSRAWFAVALVVALLAGDGLQYLMQMVDRLRSGEAVAHLARVRLIVAGGIAGGVVCGGFALLNLDLPETGALSVLIGASAVGALLLVAFSGRLNSRIVAFAFVSLTFIDLAWTGRNWLEWRGAESWLRPHQALAERLLDLKPERIYSPTYSVEQQVAAVYELRLFGGVDPFQLRGVVRAIEQGGGVASEGYSVVLPPLMGVAPDEDIAQANRDAVPDTTILAAWNVSHIVAAYPIDHQQLEPVDTVDSSYIYANQDFAPETFPTWPDDWPGLPDADALDQLNQLTVIAALVSAITFIMCLALLSVKLKANRDG